MKKLVIILLFIICAITSVEVRCEQQPPASFSASMAEMQRLCVVAGQGYGTKQHLELINNFYSAAMNQPSVKWKAMAIEAMCRYYYQRLDIAKVLQSAKVMEALPLSPEIYEYYFGTLYMRSSVLLVSGRVGESLKSALAAQQKSQSVGSREGELYNYEIIGSIYEGMRNYEKANEAFRVSLELLRNTKVDATHQEEVLINNIRANAYLQNSDAMEECLLNLKALVEKEGGDKNSAYSVRRGMELYYGYAVKLSCLRRKMDDAKKYMDKLNDLPYVEDWYANMLRSNSMVSYYEYTGNYQNALVELDNIQSISPVIDIKTMVLRSEILASAKEYNKACETLNAVCEAEKKVSYEDILIDFSKLQKRNMLVSLRASSVENLAKAEKQKYYLIIAGLIAVILAIIVLRFLSAYANNMSKMLIKNETMLKDNKFNLERKQRELVIASAKAKDSGQLKSSFLSNMSHEIRTPLNSIIGFSELISDMAEDAEHKAYADLIHTSSEMLLVMVNNILDLGRMDSGRMKYIMEDCSVEEVIREASFRVGSKPGVNFVIKVDPEVSDIVCDHMKFQQILYNLLTNAYKFVERGEVRMLATREGSMMVLRCEDTGIGIAPENVSRIFRRFEKVNSFTSGPGLGLAICDELAKHLGGNITVDTEYKGGAAFVLKLPVKGLSSTTNSEVRAVG